MTTLLQPDFVKAIRQRFDILVITLLPADEYEERFEDIWNVSDVLGRQVSTFDEDEREEVLEMLLRVGYTRYTFTERFKMLDDDHGRTNIVRYVMTCTAKVEVHIPGPRK